jgi:hypothetical protein
MEPSEHGHHAAAAPRRRTAGDAARPLTAKVTS